MRGKITDILFDESQINSRVAELGAEINADYAGRDIFGVCLLKGSIIFCADLVRHIKVPIRVDVMRASSYGSNTESSGSVKILQDLDIDIAGKDVLIIEDIVDTGRTLHKTLELLTVRHPNSLKVCTLLDKPSRRVEEIDIAYRGFSIPDKFVVGYGLDFDEYYRNLPYISVLDPNG
ncbi:hypoxanthine phosphoribosyltransferase [Sulfidibacter corallicola]|uniref:Hypoxanthine phosphoribosyltransferase n=1 Tax=Sulfidibacter corallicola TaxID=2818388 RepID=A0A8A4THI5_SULCO|nr:hypoxanthine phosphoribosyltransferase [Sulfidibacter corallicola]QTD48218.1 hypoxanthine phosphoribosyltransferase [Sulfidibacter corallicola]